METSPVRVLVVEDSEAFRKFYCSTLRKRAKLQIIGEVTDGIKAVQKAEELQPDLIVLDVGLPSLNGIEVARRVRKVSPMSKILFVSQESSADVVEEALGTGARGYVVKTDAARELLEALDAVLRGERFVGKRLSRQDFVGASDAGASRDLQGTSSCAPFRQNVEIASRHDVGFYSDDASLVDDLAQLIGTALKTGNAAIVVATESHRDSLLLRLQTHGLDIAAAIQQGRYIALDAADALSMFMQSGMPDRVLFSKLLGDLIVRAADAAKGQHSRVTIFGECVHLLWAQGNVEAAIEMEKLGNQLAKRYNVDILCGYSLDSVQPGMDSHIFQQICEEHSAVYSR